VVENPSGSNARPLLVDAVCPTGLESEVGVVFRFPFFDLFEGIAHFD
jgi:hypothetical protein